MSMQEFYQYNNFAEGIHNLAHKKIERNNLIVNELINYFEYYYDNFDKNNHKDISFMFNYLNLFFSDEMKDVFNFCDLFKNIDLKKKELEEKMTFDVSILMLKNSLIISNKNNENMTVPYNLEEISKFFGYKENTIEYKIFYLLLNDEKIFDNAVKLYALKFLK